MENTYLSDKDIASRFGVTRQSIWRWARGGDFPRPIRLSPGCARWKLSEVENWEAEQAAAREVAG